MRHNVLNNIRACPIGARNLAGAVAALLIFLLSGCTTASWVVDEEPVMDQESKTVVSDSTYFGEFTTPNPQNPVLELDFLKNREVEYSEHLISRRYIQQYRPRYGYLALGITGMGIGLYLANTSVIDADKLSTRERALLNTAAISLGAASYLSMKPVGEARAAGEERQLQQTGKVVVRDTIPAELSETASARLTISRGQDTLVDEESVGFEENRLAIHLIEKTGLQQLEANDTLSLDLLVTYNGFEYRSRIPISDIMQKFVVTTSSDVPIRTSPALISNNIIRHVGAESRFPFLSDVDDAWYRILKSGGAAYVQNDEVDRIWRIADLTETDHMVVQSDRPVFGDLQVERNLPDNQRANSDAIAVIISNGAYEDPVRILPYADRVAQLASHYLHQTAGLYSENIVVYEDMTKQQMIDLMEDSDSLMIGGRHLSPEESDLFFYYYGHAFTDDEDRLYLLPVDYDPGARTERIVPFDDMAHMIGDMRSRSSVIVMDTDWSRAAVFGQESGTEIRIGHEKMEDLSMLMGSEGERTAVYWAAEPGELAGPYSGSNDRYRYPYDIFTWYFFRSIQDGSRSAGEVSDYLERNVPFTSRRLHDRSQNPVFFGNRDMIFIPDSQETETPIQSQTEE